MRLFTIMLIMVCLPVTLHAQGSSSDGTVTEGARSNVGINSDSTTVERVMSPAADPRVFYDPYRDIHRVQNGIYFGRKHVGIESTYRVPESSEFLSLYAGLIDTESSQSFWSAGFSYGREFRLSDIRTSAGSSNVEYYFRAGPGIGIAGTGTFTRNQTEYYLGLNSTIYLGAQYHFNEKTSLFIHGGGKMFWFPLLNEVGFTTVPVISVGLQFSTSPRTPYIRY